MTLKLLLAIALLAITAGSSHSGEVCPAPAFRLNSKEALRAAKKAMAYTLENGAYNIEHPLVCAVLGNDCDGKKRRMALVRFESKEEGGAALNILLVVRGRFPKNMFNYAGMSNVKDTLDHVSTPTLFAVPIPELSEREFYGRSVPTPCIGRERNANTTHKPGMI